MSEHHPSCFQSRPSGGIPSDLPHDLCDCRTLWMLEGAKAGAVKMSVVCTITGCGQRFELPITRDLYGMLTWSDLAEVTVTAPVTPEFAAHQDEHRRDGSFYRHFVKTARSYGQQADKIAQQLGDE